MQRFIDGEPPKSEASTFAMGSIVTQTVWGGEDSVARAHRAIVELEDRISWRLEGDIARLNQAGMGQEVELDPDVAGLLASVRELSWRSNGTFDPTIGQITRLWNFDQAPALPCPEAIAGGLETTGWSNLYLTANIAQRESDFALDLGAVGKGAALDAAVASYERSSVDAAVIAVGGSVALYGEKPDGPWKVAVRDPEGSGSLGTLELPAGYISTSGSYEKYFVEDGVTYHHILDPRTGYPAESGLVSVTVFCPAGTEDANPGALSDGLATACFVLGREKSPLLLESYGAEAVFIDNEHGVWLTDGLEQRFTLSADGYQLKEN